MKLNILIYFIVVFVSVGMWAQPDKESIYKAAKQTYLNEDSQSITYHGFKALADNPAFNHYTKEFVDEVGTWSEFIGNGTVSVGHRFNQVPKGDYQFDWGDRQRFSEVEAKGFFTQASKGTLFGTMAYGQENRENSTLNYAINPEIYYPYLVSDTLGNGDKRYEHYQIQGGYSFAKDDTYLGIGISYKGVASSRITEPRLSIYDSWFKVDVGLLQRTKQGLISLQVYPEFNRQMISSSNVLNKAPAVLQFIGLGQWKNTPIKVGQSYERSMTVVGAGGSLGYKQIRQPVQRWSYQANIHYNYRHMNTFDNSQLGFESNTKLNLFTRNTHVLSPMFVLDYHGSHATWAWMYQGNNSFSKGSEHIYESKKVSSSQNLYDYVKVATNAFYTQRDWQNALTIEREQFFDQTHKFTTWIKLKHRLYQEKYIYHQQRVASESLAASIGIGYTKMFTKSSLNIKWSYTNQKTLSSTYQVYKPLEKVAIRQSYIPFVLRTEPISAVEWRVSYQHAMTKQQTLGVALSGKYAWANEDYHGPYTIDLSNYDVAVNNRIALGVKVFYLF